MENAWIIGESVVASSEHGCHAYAAVLFNILIK
jgi:hypothetical protein